MGKQLGLALVIAFFSQYVLAASDDRVYVMVGSGNSQYMNWDGENRDGTLSVGVGAAISDNIMMELGYTDLGSNTGVAENTRADFSTSSLNFAFVFKKPKIWGESIYFFGKWGFERWALEGTLSCLRVGENCINTDPATSFQNIDDTQVTIWGGAGLGASLGRFDLNLIHEWHKFSIDATKTDQSIRNIQLQFYIRF